MVLPYTTDPSPLPKFYVCSSVYNNNNCRSYVSDDPKALCSNCKNHMSREITYVKPISYYEEDVGYVKDLVTYIVMDDLSIMPMSNIPTTTLLKKFNIKDMGTLEEKLITFNVSEGVKLLEASLQSKTVLTDVFLGEVLSPPKTVSKGKKPTPK
uniref:DUF674 domain-containing protein n=1 Tax=Cucumis melo TaxID=3656 RepID=A0A9I9EIK3_CUCME